jgi:hypothetical protein
MPSLESDLLQGPENSVFCAVVAEAVIAEVLRLRSRLAALTALSAEAAALKAQVAELTAPVAVHANMLRGTIAKPTVEQIIHLYSVDALCKALAPVIVREAGRDPAFDVMTEVIEFLCDFGTAKIDALRYDRGRSSPEDDPDPVVNAEEVWNWQQEARQIYETLTA